MQENNKKLYIKKDKILEYNEKSHKDTEQLFSKLHLGEENFNALIEKYSTFSNEDLNSISNVYPNKGNTLWLEVNVEDSYNANALFSWLYSNSNFDNTNGLLVFGCRLKSIMFHKPSGYSQEEKEAVKMLYQKMFGDDLQNKKNC